MCEAEVSPSGLRSPSGGGMHELLAFVTEISLCCGQQATSALIQGEGKICRQL